MLTEPLLVVGWSARAAAQSARRAGFKVQAIDAFGDVDLRQAVDGWKRLLLFDHLRRTAADLPPGPWMYAGGLENHPRAVAGLTRDRILLGNNSTSLQRVRDPFLLQSTLAEYGFAFPETRRSIDAAADEAWLVKRFRSGGGIGVRPFDPRRPPSRDEFLQRVILGDVFGASYVAAAGCSQLVGVCQSIKDDDAPSSFRYRGSIGPVELPAAAVETLKRLGDLLANKFNLVGLFGVDFVFDGDEVWSLEVNPRYTASMELLERAANVSLIEAHVVACQENRFLQTSEPSTTMLYGKRIVYHDGAEPLHVVDPPDLPDLADIPAPNTVVQPGDPFITVFAAGTTPAEVAEQLLEREREIKSRWP